MRIVSINGEHVLDKIVTSNGQKVDTLNNVSGLINRRRHLDHHTDRRHINLSSFFKQFTVALGNELFCFINFRDATHHGQHNTQKRANALIGPDHRPHLSKKNFRVVERHANTAPTQKRICFFNRKIRKGFVSTDIQGSHGDISRRESLQMLPVDRFLFLFSWKTIFRHEVNFGSIKTHALRSAIKRFGCIGHQTCIHP